MGDLNDCEVDADFTVLDCARRTLCVLEIDDSKAFVARLSTVGVFRHETALDDTIFCLDFCLQLLLAELAGDLSQANALRVNDLGLVISLLLSFLSLKSFGIESSLFRSANCRQTSLLVLFSLIFL